MKSNQAVTFSDGSAPIVDLSNNGSIAQDGIVTAFWDGQEWSVRGDLV